MARVFAVTAVKIPFSAHTRALFVLGRNSVKRKITWKLKTKVNKQICCFKLEDPQTVPSVRPSNLVKAASVGSLLNLDAEGPMSGEPRVRSGSVKSTRSDNSQYHSDKYSMMEFAMHYFRFGRLELFLKK